MGYKKRKARSFGLLVILAAVICGVTIIATLKVQKERDEKLAEKERLENLIQKENLESTKLDAKKEYASTRKFVEEMARKVLGLVYPDEIIFEEESGKQN